MKAYKNTLPASKNNKSCLNCFSPGTFIWNFICRLLVAFWFARSRETRRFSFNSMCLLPDCIYQVELFLIIAWSFHRYPCLEISISVAFQSKRNFRKFRAWHSNDIEVVKFISLKIHLLLVVLWWQINWNQTLKLCSLIIQCDILWS